MILLSMLNNRSLSGFFFSSFGTGSPLNLFDGLYESIGDGLVRFRRKKEKPKSEKEKKNIFSYFLVFIITLKQSQLIFFFFIFFTSILASRIVWSAQSSSSSQSSIGSETEVIRGSNHKNKTF
ncbi:hypothetical protein NH340_JMT05300 [Sarcoptes scabiei]|nr:hypothetical protein NH340_JMT05300 [Sarcoptes scabiei]